MSNLAKLPDRILATVAARHLQIAPATAKRLIERGDLVGVRIGGRLYVTVVSFDRYVQRITANTTIATAHAE